MDHRESVRGGQDRGQQIRRSDRPVPALPCQFPPGFQRSLPVFVLGRQDDDRTGQRHISSRAPYANVSKGSAYRIAPVVVRICL